MSSILGSDEPSPDMTGATSPETTLPPVPDQVPAVNAPAPIVISTSHLPEWLDLVSSVVGSLAWPVTVAVLVLLFKERITQLVDAVLSRIPSMTSFKVAGTEATWSNETLNEVVTDLGADDHPKPPGDHDSPRPELANRLAHVKPGSGVIEAFLGVEREARRYIDVLDLQNKSSPVAVIQRAPGVPLGLRHAIRGLARLRNAAAHGGEDITLPSALTYIEAAKKAEDELRAITEKTLRGEQTF